jgi:hypothetical protein
MQRTHKRTTPLTDKELVAAREVESQRQRWDSDYITAAQARDMPVEVSSKPDMAARITRSQPDWPENRMSATEALGPLDPGAGESYERQERVDAASLFTGEVAGGAIPAGRKE